MKFNKIIMVIALILIGAVKSYSAIYTVDAAGGYDYTSISACADAAQAGDTCSVRNGSYAGFTAPRSGAAGALITFRAASGHFPKVTSNISLSGRSYIHVEGFTISGSVSCSGSRGSNLKIIGNTVSGMMTMDADYVLISDNTFNNMSNDAVRQFGQYFVVRNNVMVHQVDSNNVHMDFWQSWCESGRTTPPSYLLLENNTFVDISGGNVHFSLMNETSACSDAPTNHIYRYNKLHNLGSNGIYVDTSGHSGQGKMVIYNNTFSKMFRGAASWNEYTCDMRAAINSTAVNNIITDSVKQSGVIGFLWGSGGAQSYNLYYDPGYTLSFSGLASSEVGAVKNQNPLLGNMDALDFSISVSSPAKDAGGPLTTVAASDSGSGTSLAVAEAEFFQPGWAGAAPDWIAVGSVSNIAQISSINYSTNTITLTSGISRTAGDPVWLYKKSDGAIVLKGNAPDIGAVEFGESGESISTPVNLRLKIQ